MIRIFGLDFKGMMKEKDFFCNYLIALNKALNNDNINYGFFVYDPYMYIKNTNIRNEMDLFEQKYFIKYKDIFELVSNYFDAKSHDFQTVNNIKIKKYRLKLIEIKTKYELIFNCGR